MLGNEKLGQTIGGARARRRAWAVSAIAHNPRREWSRRRNFLFFSAV